MDLCDLCEMFRHNTWANERLLSVCSGLEPRFLTATVPGVGTVHDALVHLAWVELGYLWLIDHQPVRALRRRDSLEAGSLAHLSEALARIGRGYIEWIEDADAGRLQGQLPAISRDPSPLTVRRALLHILTHSATHRTEVLAALSAVGVAVPDLDYLRMVREEAS